MVLDQILELIIRFDIGITHLYYLNKLKRTTSTRYIKEQTFFLNLDLENLILLKRKVVGVYQIDKY